MTTGTINVASRDSENLADKLGRLTVYENLRSRGLTHDEITQMSAEELFIEWFQYVYGNDPNRPKEVLYVWQKIQKAKGESK